MRGRGALLVLLVLVLLTGAAIAAWVLVGRAVPTRAPGRPPEGVGLRPRPAPAQVRLSTSPPGARITLDGELLDRVTPDLFEVAPLQPHELRVDLEGHEPRSVELRLDASEVREVRLELRPTRAAVSP